MAPLPSRLQSPQAVHPVFIEEYEGQEAEIL
jgi:hypothetical protein